MKNIKNYDAKKYSTLSMYKNVSDGIYKYSQDGDVEYVTSLSFEQEVEYGEEEFADNISQYPLEDILDEFSCYISDFYDELNKPSSKVCYLEFSSPDIEDIRRLRSIIGKHVYNQENDEEIELIIE